MSTYNIEHYKQIVKPNLKQLGRKWRSVNKYYNKNINECHTFIHFLHYFDNRPVSEIASELGLTTQRIYQIMESVNASLETKGGDLS